MRLHTEGFGATDLDLDLGKCNHVVGPNGAGKSKIADAIRFVFLGYVPALGKRPLDTAALLRGREMSARLILDDGRVITRTMRQRGDGYETDCECSWLEAAKPTEHHAAAVRLLGEDEADVAECLDIRELLSLSGNKRVSRLRELAEETSDPDALADLALRYTVQRLAGIDDEKMPQNHLTALPFIEGFDEHGDAHSGVYAELRRVFPDVEAKLLQAGIEGAVQWVREEKNAARRAAKEKREARAELEQQLASLPAVDVAEMASLEEERTNLDRELGAEGERASARAKRIEQIDTAETRVREARGRFEAARAAAAAAEWTQIAETLSERMAVIDEQLAAPEPERDRSLAEAIEAEIAAVEAEIAAWPELAAPDTSDLEARLAELSVPTKAALPPAPDTTALDEEIRRLEREEEPKEPDARALEASHEAVVRAAERLMAATGSDWATALRLAAEIREISARIPEATEITARADQVATLALRHLDPAQIKSLEAAVHEATAAEAETIAAYERQRDEYGAALEGYRKRRSLLEAIRQERQNAISAYEHDCEQIMRSHESLEDRRATALAEVRGLLDASRAEYERLREEHSAATEPLRNRRGELRLSLQRARDEARKEREGRASRLAALRAERKEIADQVEKARRSAADLAAAASSAESALASAEQARADLGAPPPPVADTGKIMARLGAVRERLGALRAVQAQRDELTRIAAELDQLAARAKVCEALDWACKRAAAESLPGGALMRMLQAFLGAAGRTEQPYLRVETNVCELGWRTREHGDVPLQALSGGEYLLFAAALTSAVTILRRAELRLVLVEAAEADEGTLRQLHAGLSSIAGEITAAVAMSWHARAEAGWHRIELAAPAERAAA